MGPDLLVGLADLVYPHGTVDSPSTADGYRIGVLHMLGRMSEHGLSGGAATLMRRRPAEYRAAAGKMREATARAIPGVDSIFQALDPRSVN